MPEEYTGLNFGSFKLSEFTNLLFKQVTDSYFHSISEEDLFSSVDPLNVVFEPVGTSTSVYTPVSIIDATFTPA